MHDTAVISKREPQRVVMETLGQSRVSLTLNTYSHVLKDLKEDAADKMDAILAGC